MWKSWCSRNGTTDEVSLVLKDGTMVHGMSFGANVSAAGEVVFNTGMVGYPEALTDPSYAGQILVLTSPMVGNYGVPSDERDEYGLLKHFESNRIQIAGLVVSEYSNQFSHWNAAQSLSQWLKKAGVPAMFGVDTRQLTKKIRETGSLLGKIEFEHLPMMFDDPNDRNLVAEVSTKQIHRYNQSTSNAPTILAIDCGIKNNIIRLFLHVHKVNLVVVPHDYNLELNEENIVYDGIFVSNGPGNPAQCSATIASLKYALQSDVVKPIFGICLGNQLLALACGATTYKMKYGNRGMNQPCIDLRTAKCYMTSQNHGYAVNNDSLPHDWKPMFINANDHSNEGIVHTSKSFFSVQFHPEACGGPNDTVFLFDEFLDAVKGTLPTKVLLNPQIYQQPVYKKVLIIGSGGLSIGQAGEFDYSGSQAIKALKEENIEVILINPNIATVQTSKHVGHCSADKVYFLPITHDVVRDIIIKDRPDGILVSVGGQTALNVGIELHQSGVFDQYNCHVLGTSIDTIVATENREIFSRKLKEINETLAESISACTVEEAIVAANIIKFPVLVRAAFALGGLGSGFAENETELRELCSKAFAISQQILIDKDLRGWIEVEYEIVRDCRNTCIAVTNMLNFDPVGVHTGDSIVVTPSQTLSNSEYFLLRSTSLKVVKSLGIIGECNIQFALNPQSEEYCIIEVNARLSRSSALASKATGYPLAYVATKLCLGKDLISVRNSVTTTTTACFEPSLDYCAVKIPRWDLKKFSLVSTKLGSSMTSVGEVMAIGRNFVEAIQKAVRMVSGGELSGLDGDCFSQISESELDDMLKIPTDCRLYAIQAALERGYTVDRIYDLSKVDRWFLSKLKNISDLKTDCKGYSLNQLNYCDLKLLKCHGFSDQQIGTYTNSSALCVRFYRKQLGLFPCCKQIDTVAAEYPTHTNYLYMTYNGAEHDIIMTPSDSCQRTQHYDKSVSRFSSPVKRQRVYTENSSTTAKSSTPGNGVIVLGCGAYCIGSSVEFDWCAVSTLRQLRVLGKRTIMINYNPETVSTDFSESDSLYFEELTEERVLDIYEFENSEGIILSCGGQIPNNLALPLHQQGVHILGTSAENIDRAENRHKFSLLLDAIGVDQPEWKESTTLIDAHLFALTCGYPVIVRPSFVLSGAAMRVASNEIELQSCLLDAKEISMDKPVVISKFILNAKEIEYDGVAENGVILNYAICEHVENAGIHSGDATLVLPAQKLYVQTVRSVKQIATEIAKALHISGPFNIQLLAKDNKVRVIECNVRASRSFPFVSKTFDTNFITLATKVIVGYPCKPYNISLYDIDYIGCLPKPCFLNFCWQ